MILIDTVSQESNISASIKNNTIQDTVLNVTLDWEKVLPSIIINSQKQLWPSHPLT